MPALPFDCPLRKSLPMPELEITVSKGLPDPERFQDLDPQAVPVAEVVIMLSGTVAGQGAFYMWNDRGGSFEEIWIAPPFRRKGIATAVYDAFEELGLAVEPSEHLDEDGLLFWESRLARRSARPAG